MLATKEMPDMYHEWNSRHGAPYGRNDWLDRRILKRIVPWPIQLKLRGSFSIQPNNTIRYFEYPWAFFSINPTSGTRVLEIGGGLSGFQFVLSRAGCEVVNVDPGLEAKGKGWACNIDSINYLNKVFRTNVRLENTTIEGANLEAEYFDIVCSISAMEHFLEPERKQVMKSAYDLLRPGGYFILSVDLFLDLSPFTSRPTNMWGVNVNLSELISMAPFVLDSGKESELYGFAEFDVDEIQSNLSRFLVGNYPALAQCLVLKKPI